MQSIFGGGGGLPPPPALASRVATNAANAHESANAHLARLSIPRARPPRRRPADISRLRAFALPSSRADVRERIAAERRVPRPTVTSMGVRSIRIGLGATRRRGVRRRRRRLPRTARGDARTHTTRDAFDRSVRRPSSVVVDSRVSSSSSSSTRASSVSTVVTTSWRDGARVVGVHFRDSRPIVTDRPTVTERPTDRDRATDRAIATMRLH